MLAKMRRILCCIVCQILWHDLAGNISHFRYSAPRDFSENARLPKSQPAGSVPMTEYVAASQAACFLHSLSCATDVPRQESDLPVVPSPGKVRILWKLNVTSLSCPASPTCHSEFVTVDREQS